MQKIVFGKKPSMKTKGGALNYKNITLTSIQLID